MFKINIKYLLVSLLGAIIFCAAGYKYFEWSVLNTLSETYNKSWKEELRLAETIKNTANDITKITEESKEVRHADILIVKGRVIIDQQEQYDSILQRNKSEFQKLQRKSNFLMGDKKRFVQEVTRTQIAYYDNESQISERTLALLRFYENVFNLEKEAYVLADFEENAHGDEAYYAANIGEIAVFKKYTNENHRFAHEDEIKKYYPKTYEFMQNSKEFYAMYYEVMEDFARDDRESAAYKSVTLQEKGLDMNVDPEDLLGAEKEREKQAAKKSLSLLIEQVKKINAFEKSIPSYPLLPAVHEFEEDLVQCMFYAYKTNGLYVLTTDEYPDAKNYDALLVQLNTLSPRSEDLDKDFDKKALTLTNDDKKISYTCSDKANKEKFVFESFKYETE